ncbi:maleylpyruvate isomerase family mycothiol-dependent enzyme [Geodermatophilus sp. URMC 61]|uniref:maleylpyruvate isomerase family mycothiol-dependent enzyme n=1 Tax=Geodermatophilus sp. URMC 61 TaxID=3423411 RepID=UPI00406BE551
MDGLARFGPRVDARQLFEQDRAVLLRLVQDLDPDEWERPTAAAPWVVRDVVAHLLGDDLSRLARTRDGHSPVGPQQDEPLAAFIHRFNDEWVQAARRVSPRLLVDLLDLTSPQVLALWQDIDLDATTEPVTWAGPEPAPVWLDCARDFTEYWVHQQQIRDATGRTDDGDPAVVHLVLDTFLRAMPQTLAGHDRPEGTTMVLAVTGAGGGQWGWQRQGGRWRPVENADGSTLVTFSDAETLWRLCTRLIEPEEAKRRVTVVGDHALADAALRIVSIIR